MHAKRSIGEVIFDIFNHGFLLFWGLIALYPMLYVLFASVSDAGRLAGSRGILLYPLGINLDSYIKAMQHPLIASGYRNTLLIVVCGTSLNLLMTSLGAYFLSRKNVLWRNAIMVMIVITMYFGGGLIPSFLVVRSLGLLGSLLAVILPGAVSAWNMIVMRTSIQNLPDALEEAAIIDGAGHFTILFKVVLPLSKAVLAVMTLWYGVGHWNSWFSAAIYLSKRELWPIQLVMREIVISTGVGGALSDMTADVSDREVAQVRETLKYAMIIIATAPILCIYPFLQKFFVKGVMVGSLKG